MKDKINVEFVMEQRMCSACKKSGSEYYELKLQLRLFGFQNNELLIKRGNLVKYKFNEMKKYLGDSLLKYVFATEIQGIKKFYDNLKDEDLEYKGKAIDLCDKKSCENNESSENEYFDESDNDEDIDSEDVENKNYDNNNVDNESIENNESFNDKNNKFKNSRISEELILK